MPGTLFVVATPIGNLEDITLRAIRTLRAVDLIAAEDTRRTAKLLSHYNIHKSVVSLHAHNEHREAPKLIARIAGGTSVALVSDAGTPAISDPGAHLVRLAREAGIKVTPIPGPNSIAAALSVSGLPASQFVFLGFPPRSGKERREWMASVQAEARTVAFFEAPHRIERTLSELAILLGDRQIQVQRELTKIHEQLVIWPYNALDAVDSPRGEFVVLVANKKTPPQFAGADDASAELATRLVGCMTTTDAFEIDDAVSLAAKATGLDLIAVKKAWKKHRISEGRRRDRLS